MRNLFTCDICNQVIKINGWYEEPAEVHFALYVASQNPLAGVSTNKNYQRAEFKKDEVCNSCRKQIAAGFAKVLEEAIAKKEP